MLSTDKPVLLGSAKVNLLTRKEDKETWQTSQSWEEPGVGVGGFFPESGGAHLVSTSILSLFTSQFRHTVFWKLFRKWISTG